MPCHRPHRTVTGAAVFFEQGPGGLLDARRIAGVAQAYAGFLDVLLADRRAWGDVAAGEDHAARLHGGEGLLRLAERHDLGIDPLLAHAPRDELRHLGAEIDDQNFVVLLGRFVRHVRCFAG